MAENNDTNIVENAVDYNKKTLKELITICKENGIRGYSGKKKEELVQLVKNKLKVVRHIQVEVQLPIVEQQPAAKPSLRQDIIHGDVLRILPTLGENTAQIIIADPPYNIGKDFGNDSDKQSMADYLKWTDVWISQCLRILKPNGTMFIYGFSENLALILSRIPQEINRRWIIWHYTNKNVVYILNVA